MVERGWSRTEVEAAVTFYREMLHLELSGTSYSKRQRNQDLQKIIGRSAGSIEFKHQNISAILNNAGFPYISGYKPRGNFQNLLEEVVVDRLFENREVNDLAAAAVARHNFSPILPADILSIRVTTPVGASEAAAGPSRVKEDFHVNKKRNYVEIEGRNSALGLAGENLILGYEHERLWRAGQRKLAEKIEHVSKDKGDYLGYDILSFEADGRKRLIEVKTTQFGAMTPFFATRNEVNVSIELSEHYQLYRLFSFSKDPKLFTLEGAIGKHCQLTPAIFSAVPK